MLRAARERHPAASAGLAKQYARPEPGSPHREECDRGGRLGVRCRRVRADAVPQADATGTVSLRTVPARTVETAAEPWQADAVSAGREQPNCAGGRSGAAC